ncbi:conserved Plasmodium protein, unknown function [Plasmodium vinckei vinckei]|uniref:Fam-a protein n=1 Tax=Plasmodium vinckei vinckei TaxID=54757 RepID=A0A449BZ32_PLAVN|nr:conserved Plasmodium protein, unknown function [Plasmodium vinckei vinckei]VEV58694.1 conserved Plasmodium protein, unknown function [Plasmodium vinckei vinckei]
MNTILFVFFSYLPLILFGVCSISLNKISFDEEIKEYLNHFLILRNSQNYCEGKNLLLAPNLGKHNNLSKVLDICDYKKTCDYISYSDKRVLRNSIFYEDDKEVENTGANWICSGNKWIFARPRKYWVTAIKGNHIKDQMKNYRTIYMNMSGECDKNNILMKISKDISPKEAAEECNRVPNCEFIILDYNKKLGSEENDKHMSILCSRPPINRVSKLGFLIAEKNNESRHNIAKNNKDRRKIIINKEQTALNGSIVPDDNYYNYKKGDIAYAQ